MAIWQFDFYLIKKYIVDNNLNKDEFLFNSVIDKESLVMIKKWPLTESWSKDIILYGENDSTCIELDTKGECIIDIRVRLDLRALTTSDIKNIINFIRMNDAYIFYDKKTYKPDIKVLLSLIKKSSSFKCIKNPEAFFKSLL